MLYTIASFLVLFSALNTGLMAVSKHNLFTILGKNQLRYAHIAIGVAGVLILLRPLLVSHIQIGGRQEK